MKNRTDIINYFIEKYNYNNYLEIGIDNPNNNFNKIICRNKTGVDPHKACDFKMTSDDFFSQLKKTNFYDIIFIDGLHTSSQVLKDIKNSLNCLSAEGTIIVHDCNPATRRLQRPLKEYHRGAWCGDV